MRFAKVTAALLAVSAAFGSEVPAQQKQKIDPARVDGTVKSAFPTAPADWQARLTPDETMQQCSAANNTPPAATFETIQARARASIQYPADGKFVGNWKAGEGLAQSGYGLRFTDTTPNRVNGGNCYACHQITKQEVSYGTIGPSLLQYGKARNFSEADAKRAYEKIYDPHASFPCSLMPRFGTNKVLTIAQIVDIVALLMSPDSPANK
ncbi:MAG: sulfur oxidation c-type cytochrome SoxX [Xanthobacteraceae bacterium]|nr:sulfur oxidation c-type cytochrome SoxX [Xanthobacteraceae bacterium]